MLNRNDLFSTPVFSIGVSNYQEINIPLIDKIYELRQKEKGVSKSNILGWQSSTNLEDLAEFAVLKQMFDKLVNFIIKDLGYNTTLVMANSWASINPPNASNQIHYHANSILSGAYYLKVPEPVSSIHFYDPRQIKMFIRPEFSNINDYSSDKITFDPKEGLVLIFPSWLQHSVDPNMSTEDRVSLSFNYNTAEKLI
jgi:uncharacterized protein (TIGR02466 family)